MSDQDGLEDADLPSTAALTPVQRGRGLALPPVVPIVALLCLLAGLGFGLALARGPNPAHVPAASLAPASPAATSPAPPSPAPAVGSTGQPVAFGSTPSPSIPPGPAATSQDLPPSDGLTLQQALQALATSGLDVSPGVVVSARVARDRDVSSGYANPTDQWVWVLSAKGDFGGPTACPSRFEDPAALARCGVVSSTEVIILDYRTGALVEAYPIPVR
jgi:hypothetical protein